VSKYVSVDAEVSRKVVAIHNEGFLSSLTIEDTPVKTPKKKSKKKK